jgi:hypothetical protein
MMATAMLAEALSIQRGSTPKATVSLRTTAQKSKNKNKFERN